MKQEILEKVKEMHDGELKYCGGQLSRRSRSLYLEFVSNKAVKNETEEEEIAKALRVFTPSTIRDIEVKIKKVVTCEEFVKKSVCYFLKTYHKSCSEKLNESNIECSIENGKVIVTITVENAIYSFIISRGIDGELKNYLESQYVEYFQIILRDSGVEAVDKSVLETKVTENDLRKNIVRTLRVDDVTRLFDGDTTATASYMADVKDFLGEVYLAGVVTSIRELMTKSETPKAYYIIEFTDRTGSVSGTIFPTKANLPKVQKIQEKSEIIVRGVFESRNGYHNLRILSINLCCFPKNFVPIERPKRPVNKEYYQVFPQELVLENQSNFLLDDSMPDCFKGRTFVAFDLETTGTGDDDKITEIGAVRIEDGKFISYFNTLVNPHKPIPADVIGITGITNEMVADAPSFEEVCGDFYKYCYGASLVAHNIEFDSKFIRRQGKPLDYVFDHPLIDTLSLARQNIHGVTNYKLNTLCDKFNIKFNHHRAYSDALACAKLLVEIMRIKKDFDF